jgi:putative hydrolase of the HAD superfamily
MPRGLIVDLDDTLYPHRQFMRSGFRAVAQYAASRHGLNADAAFATLAACLTAGESRKAFQQLCADHGVPDSDIPHLLQAFREHQPSLTLDEDVAATLRRLRTAGWRIAVLTNGLPSIQEKKLGALGVLPLVDHVIYAEQHAPAGKPAAEPFRYALSRLDIGAGRCVCVGDDPIKDIAGARRLGIRTIRVARHAAVEPRGDADAVVLSFGEVPVIAAALLEKVASHAA